MTEHHLPWSIILTVVTYKDGGLGFMKYMLSFKYQFGLGEQIPILVSWASLEEITAITLSH